MHLLRHLLFSEVSFQFTFYSAHIPRLENSITDALSRFHWQEFRQLAPDAMVYQTRTPECLLQNPTDPLWNYNA